MSGVAFDIDLTAASRRLAALNEGQLALLVDEVGALVARQTQDRIEDEKRSPDGNAWAAWSPSYARTRNTGNARRHSLLLASGTLRESIQSYSRGLEAVVGSNMIYAAVHQFGSSDGKTTARPYLGLSDANRLELEDFITGRIEDLLQ